MTTSRYLEPGRRLDRHRVLDEVAGARWNARASLARPARDLAGHMRAHVARPALSRVQRVDGKGPLDVAGQDVADGRFEIGLVIPAFDVRAAEGAEVRQDDVDCGVEVCGAHRWHPVLGCG